MKYIDKKAFVLVLTGILLYMVLIVVSIFAIQFPNLEETVQQVINESGMSGQIDPADILSVTRVMLIVGTVIGLGLVSIFLFKLLAHRKTLKKGTYLTVLLVFTIIGAASSLIGLFTAFNWITLLNFICYGLVIAGYVIQSKAPLAPMPAQTFYGNPVPGGQYGQPPYGQNPYQQNPYQQNQNPYGQNPYAQNPYQQNPYQQNQGGQNPFPDYPENNGKTNEIYAPPRSDDDGEN